MLFQIGCLSGIPIDMGKTTISIISFTIAAILLILLKNSKLSTKLKISFIYGHLTFLFFPFILFTTNVGCGALCQACYNSLSQLVAYSIPTTLIFSTLAGFVIIPGLFVFSNKKMEIKTRWINDFVKRYSKNLGINIPKLYAIDKSKPIAFSFRSFKSAIFMSVGLLDILSIKELKAILLHELAHIAYKSSALKFSSYFLRIFSPLSVLARFHHDSNKEEKLADRFAVKEQGTNKFLVSAKRKISKYY